MPLTEAEIKNLMRRVVVRPNEDVDRRFVETITSTGAPENLAPALPELIRKKPFVVLELMNVNPVAAVVGGIWDKGEPASLDERLLQELETAKGLREYYNEFITFEDELRKLVSQGLL